MQIVSQSIDHLHSDLHVPSPEHDIIQREVVLHDSAKNIHIDTSIKNVENAQAEGTTEQNISDENGQNGF